ncbi:hypothetical protein DY000_02040724 [Brassica cretica]|uniref:Aminotransferase-like plant mobile domain-containing protein n=1 Tax=Brassica cretica TaxID=69181 RepID=A0ABQ7BK35_BRACR|nr:hypothetical protein DY000_02040724 [Brassica cretica]
MAPVRRHRSYFFDDGPHSEIQEGDLANMRRKYANHPSVGMRSPFEFERAPDRGASEIAIYEVYLEAGFRGVIPSLIGEVSSFFGFCPSQLTPFTWRTLMAIQVLGELRGVSVEEPVGYPTSCRTIDASRLVSFAAEAVAKLIMGVPRLFRWVTFLVSNEALHHSRVWGNVVRLSVSAIYDEHRRLKLERGVLFIPHCQDWLIGEVFFLRIQVQNMIPRRDLLIRQVKALVRWKLMKGWLEKLVEHWDPEEEYRRHLFLFGGIDQQLGSFSRVATSRSVVGLGNWILGVNRFSWDASYNFGPGDYAGTRRSRKDPEVVWEPGGFPLDREVIFGSGGRRGTRRFSFRSGGRTWNPEVLEIVIRPLRNPEVLPQILRSLLRTRRLSGNPEEVTDMLRGCWCGVL